jgi:hypothetical protein
MLFRLGTTCALVLCLVASPLGGTLFAAEHGTSTAEPFPPLVGSPAATTMPVEATAARDAADDRLRRSFHEFPRNAINEEQRGYRSRRGRGRGAAAAAIMIGAAAAVAGTALLVYANRPECSANHSAEGCGYGTKVAGGSFLAGGAIGIAVGAALWR